MGIIFKKQTAVREGARVNGVFLVRTLHYRAEQLEVAIRNVVL
jgi:hypothetical protein